MKIKKGFKYPEGKHWTHELDAIIKQTGFDGTWAEAREQLWGQKSTKLIRRKRAKDETGKMATIRKIKVLKPTKGPKLIYFLSIEQKDPKVEAYRQKLIKILNDFQEDLSIKKKNNLVY